jgi:SHAQKYF class myb-like DNA-binding protein
LVLSPRSLFSLLPGYSRWSAEEHKLFLEGIMLYGKDWKKMQPLIKTRSLVQIRTHAQKVFKKIGLKRPDNTNASIQDDHSIRQFQEYIQKHPNSPKLLEMDNPAAASPADREIPLAAGDGQEQQHAGEHPLISTSPRTLQQQQSQQHPLDGSVSFDKQQQESSSSPRDTSLNASTLNREPNYLDHRNQLLSGDQHTSSLVYPSTPYRSIDNTNNRSQIHPMTPMSPSSPNAQDFLQLFQGVSNFLLSFSFVDLVYLFVVVVVVVVSVCFPLFRRLFPKKIYDYYNN